MPFGNNYHMAQHKDLRTSIDSLAQTCHRKKIPLTHQRRIIMTELAMHGDHPSAEEIYQSVKELLPGISRTTVYRVLETLVRIGVAVRVNNPQACARFDADTTPHHHGVCTSCQRVLDLPLAAFDGIPFPSSSDNGFQITGYSVNFSGRCSACQSILHNENPASAGYLPLKGEAA